MSAEEVATGLFRGIPGLSRRVEPNLLDLLTSQVDHELLFPQCDDGRSPKEDGLSATKRVQATQGEC